MLGEHESIDLPQSTEYAKEMRKWQAEASRYGRPGRPYVYQEFPKMVFKATRVSGKGAQITETHIVNNDEEVANLRSRGFFTKQEDAIADLDKSETQHGILAAERNFDIAQGRMSESAAKEVRAAEEAHGSTHLPEVPVTPIKKRGRPAKAIAAKV